MTRKMLGIAAALAMAMGAGVVPTAAQTEPVLLRLKIDRGKTFYFDVAGSTKFSLELHGTEVTTTSDHTAREAVRGLSINPDGSFVIEDVLEGFRITTDGQTQDVPEPTLTITVRPNGKVIRVTPPHPMNDYPFGMPIQPVRPGESWSGPVDEAQDGIAIHGTQTFTLTAIEHAGDNRVAHIRTRIAGSIIGADLRSLPPGFQGQFSGSAHGTGTIDWLIDQGRILRTADTMSIEGTLNFTGQGETMNGPMTATLTSRRQALPTRAITVALPSPIH